MRLLSVCAAALALTLLLCAGTALAAEEPAYLVFESRIRTAGGPSTAPEAEITFRITDAPAGGRVLWSQGPQRIPLRDGYFRVILGDGGSPLEESLLDGDGARWLQVDCDGCVGRTRYKLSRRGRSVAILGAERPGRPGPAAAKPWLRNKRLHDQRAYPTGIVPAGRLPAAYAEALADPAAIPPPPGIEASPASLVEGAWTEIGPSKVINGQTSGTPRGDVSGRVNSLAVHPTDPNIAYTCGAQGGLWKTTDGGGTWTPLTEWLPSLATGAVALSLSDPEILYLGTGESNFSLDSYWGAGVFKSLDGGATLTPAAPLDPNRTPINAAAIAAMAVHPADADVVFTAAGTFLEGNSLYSAGVYRSTDGGASWTRVLGPGLSGPVVASDLRLDPSDPNIVYAALGWIGGATTNGVYKSTDGGETFVQLAGGFPTSNVGRINLAIAMDNPQVLYAAVHNPATDGLLGIWRTLDGGASWSQRTAVGASCGAQCWYDMALAVDPTDSETVFFGGVDLFRSTNGARTFGLVMQSSGSTGGLHVDQHALLFSPSNPGQFWVGNDGGVWRTDDASASTIDWVNLNGNLALLQFQSVAVPPSDPDIAYGGTQDNGTNKYTGSAVWDHVADGDGGQTAVDYITPSTVYHTYYGITFRRSENGGATWATKQTGLNTGDRSLFYIPVEMDPTDPTVLYLGSYRLYRTANRGDLWTAISSDLTQDPNDVSNIGRISAIGVSSSDPNVIFVGSSNAQIQVTSDLGASWDHRASAPLPDRYVTSLAVHPGDPDTAYATYSGFDDVATGDGHVFVTVDRGLTWADTTANLPDVPVNQIAIDPAAPQMVYLVTDIGPYVSTNGGQSWRRYSGGFPNVATFEIAVQQPNLLFAATHGRGMFQAFGCTAVGTTDVDADAVADFCDNCPGTANPSQEDGDRDAFGPPCDCADGDPARFPGAPEICNGLDDDCDGYSDKGSASPDEIGDDLAIAATGDLTWGASGLAEHYNLYRGTIAAGGAFSYNQTCLAGEIAEPEASDPSAPAAGEVFYYLVTSENCLEESGLGDGTVGPRPNANPC